MKRIYFLLIFAAPMLAERMIQPTPALNAMMHQVWSQSVYSP